MRSTSTRAYLSRDFPTAVLVALITVGIALLTKISDPLFGFWGDNAESFAPLWHHLGTELREGRWVSMDPAGWAGGNYLAEAAYGVLNPVSLANFVLMSFFDDLARGIFVVMVEFLALLAMAVFLLARSYGAGRGISIAFAVALPFGGFTLFYGASNWASGLMAITWVIWFWWAANQFVKGRLNPFVAVVMGALAITVGNPYSILGVLTVLFALAVDLVVRRQWRTLVVLVVAGASVGTFALLTYLPLMGTLAVSGRQSIVPVSNDGYLVPSIQDLLGMSSPTYIPQMLAWTIRFDYVPSTYLAWFALPLLPWVRWRTVLRSWREYVSLGVFALVLLLMTIGPSEIWLFRWPIRLVEYLYVAAAVLFALLLTPGLGREHRKARACLSGAAIFLGFFLAWGSQPGDWIRHLLVALMVGTLLTLAIPLFQKYSWRPFTAVLVAGVAVVAPIQVALFNWHTQSVTPTTDLVPAHSLADMAEATEGYEDVVLQLGSLGRGVDPESVRSGRLMWGNQNAAAGLESLNRYTGIGFPDFIASLCMDYRGSTVCPEAADILVEDVGPGYSTSYLDALGVNTLVYSKASFDMDDVPLPEGWATVDDAPDRLVLRRPEPLPVPRANGSDGVEVSQVDEQGPHHLTFDYDSSTTDGTVLLGRLAWPGYSATGPDGEQLDVSSGPAGLVEVQVPEGSGSVQVSFESPGLRRGIMIAAAGTALGLVNWIVWSVSRRRQRERSTDRSITDTI